MSFCCCCCCRADDDEDISFFFDCVVISLWRKFLSSSSTVRMLSFSVADCSTFVTSFCFSIFSFWMGEIGENL